MSLFLILIGIGIGGGFVLAFVIFMASAYMDGEEFMGSGSLGRLYP